MTYALLFAAVLFLGYSNGANDNFKGVATLYGSATATYRIALIWATICTLAGALLSVVLAHGLIAAFSGKGLIADGVLTTGTLTAVAAAGAITVLLATLLGMPTSTTHALTGALVGAGLVAAPAGIGWHTLMVKFAQPLLLSPILAIGLTAICYFVLTRVRRAAGVSSQTCVCVGRAAPQPVAMMREGEAVLAASCDGGGGTVVTIDENSRCVERYDGRFVGVDVQQGIDFVHYLSGGAVCFARAVNDTPKIAALLLAAEAIAGPRSAMMPLLLVTAAVVIGGLIHSRRIAETMSRRITNLNTGQGLTANLVTAALVLGASQMGVPVSTTHVSCGSIFGIGLVNRNARWSTVTKILVTWITTLPVGFALGAAFCWIALR